ncbi:MAG: hypothetical protein ABSE49_12430 [Polyangiaceae bacterium]
MSTLSSRARQALREADEAGEAVERDLFQRRARVLVGAAGVPSLDAVLRAARDDSRETSSGRRRAWTGLALAAACLVTVVKTRSHEGSPSTITADVESAGSGASERGGVCEDQPFSMDGREVSMMAVPPAALEGRACTAPPATFASLGTLSCDRDEANRTEVP